MSYYGQGDYYMGAGDPGLFGFLGKAVGSVARIGSSFIPGPVGAVARSVTSRLPSFGGRSRAMPAMPQLAPVGPAAPWQGGGGGRTTGGPRPKDPVGKAQDDLERAVKGLPKRSGRRMNVGNAKALRRAIRRQTGFVKLARRALQGTGYSIVSKGSRRPKTVVREHGAGGVVVH